MKKQYIAYSLILLLLTVAFGGNVEASDDCTWATDLTTLQASGDLDLFGNGFTSYVLAGNLSVQQTAQGPDIGLSLASLGPAPLSPPNCPEPSDEANVSLRYSTAGLQVPSVNYGGSLFYPYMAANLATDTGTVDLSATNLIAPLQQRMLNAGLYRPHGTSTAR